MRPGRFFLTSLTILTLLLAVLILTDLWPYLRGPAPETPEWYWVYKLRPFSRWWLPLLVALGMWGITIWWLTTKRWRLGLVALVIGNMVLQWGLVYAEKPAVLTEMIERTLADETNGYFRLAAETADLSSFLHDYPSLMPTFPSEHTRTHPPGLVVANWLVLRSFTAWPNFSQLIAERVWPLRCTDLWLLDSHPAVAAALFATTLLTSLVGALTILPVYGLARRLLPDKTARLTTALTATLPALHIFTPSPIQLDVFLAVTAVFVLQLGLERQQPGWFFLSGSIISLATFLSLGNVVLLLLAVGYAGLEWFYHRGERPFPRFLAQMVLLGLGVLAVWVIYWVGWGVPPWTIAQVGLSQHYELVTLHRRYEWWLIYNLVDIFIFAGPAVLIGFIAAFSLPRSSSTIHYSAFSIPLAILLLLLDLSGSTRGEAGRLWLFLMPFLAIGSAAFFATSQEPKVVYLPGLQLLIALAIGLAWQPIQAVIVVAERPFMPTSPTPQHSTSFAFYEANEETASMVLTGYDASQTADSLHLTLYWQAQEGAKRPYTVFTHLVNEQGELVAQQDNWPVTGLWPPTCWQEAEIVTDPYQLSLTGLPPGSYKLLVGWYDAQDNTRLHLENGEDTLLLTTVIVK